MSKNRKKDQVDLIEDIQVEELHGLLEGTEVADEDPAKLDDKEGDGDDKKPATDSAPAAAPAADQKSIDNVAAAAQAVQKQAEAPSVDSTSPTEAPKTKAGLVNALYQKMSAMTTEDLDKMYGTLNNPPPVATTPAAEPEANKLAEDDAAELQAKDDAAAPADAPLKAEKPEEVKESDDADADDAEKKDEDEDEKKVEESLTVLFAGNTSLTEDFKKNASSLFEAAVSAKVQKIVAEKLNVLEENYKAQFNEDLTKVQKTLAESVDKYLKYVVQNWMTANQVAVDGGLRTEIAEGFIAGLQNLFKESYISVPAGKTDMVGQLNLEQAKLEKQLLKATEDNMKLNETVNTLKRSQILTEASVGMASTEAAKLQSLTKDIEFDTAEAFATKVASIKESFFHKKKVETAKPIHEIEAPLNEEVTTSPKMSAYVTALSQITKNK